MEKIALILLGKSHINHILIKKTQQTSQDPQKDESIKNILVFCKVERFAACLKPNSIN
jgi:hypothetical protein